MKLFAVVLAAAAAVAAAADPPAQIHIAYAGNNAGRSDGMSVMWHTTNATATSMAKYGTAPGAYSGTITGSQSTYGFTYDHLAILPGLAPNTTYYYVVGDDAGGWSEEASFLSAPALGRTNTPWKFMAYGDMGVDNSMDTLELAYKKAPENDLVWHVGDISYADDAFLADPLKFGYENRWNEYMQAIEDIASVKPYMVLPGNHEAECHSGFCELDNTLKHKLTNFTAYNNRFRMPSPESGGAENMWYSFNYKNVAFINIDTETDYPNSPNDEYTGLKNGGFGNQIGWLQNALMKANASRAAGQVDWILVAGHRPVYSFNEEDGGVPKGSAKALQAAVEGMFNLYGVDLYMCGHVHSYERQWPTVNNVPVKSYVNPAPPVYIVNGAGGNIEGVTKYGSNPPSWNVVADSIWGLGEMTVHNGTHLQWQFFQGDTQKQVDEFWLVKTTGTHA